MSVRLHEEKSTSKNNDGEHDASKQIVELPDDPKDKYQKQNDEIDDLLDELKILHSFKIIQGDIKP